MKINTTAARIPFLVVLMGLSGALALGYEVLWVRMLGIAAGHGVATTAVVVATFLGGLGLGAWLAERPALAGRPGLAVYAALEGGIAAAGLAFPALLAGADPLVTVAYRAQATGGGWATALTLAWAALLLLVPSTLMGATLPTVARAAGANGAGPLYAANSLGAASGALAVPFVLMPMLGHRATGWTLAALGIALSCVAAITARGAASAASAPAAESVPAHRAGLALAFTSGACGMALQSAWTRGLVLFLGSSTHALALILAVFIFGLALGAALERFAVRLAGDARRAAAATLALAGLAAAASGAVLTSLPGWLAQLPQASLSDYGWICGAQMRAIAAVTLPATLAFGLLWPLSVRLAGGATGRVCAANTAGAVLGTLALPFAVLPALGLAGSIALVAVVLFTAAAVAVSARDRLLNGALAAGIGLIAVALTPEFDAKLMNSGPLVAGNGLQHLARSTSQPLAAAVKAGGRILFHREGALATVAVREVAGHTRTLLINGKPDASSHGDMSTQRLLAHLPLALVPDATDVLVIGLGAGVTAGSALKHPVKRVTVAEVSPEVVAASRYFLPASGDPLSDPRTELVLADGRTHVERTDRRFDVITSEPTNPWISGVGALFTREFFGACRARLKKDGVMVQWLQAYGLTRADFASVVATFRTAFPGATLWRTVDGADYLLVGRTAEGPIAASELRRALARPEVRADLAPIRVIDELDLLSRFVCGPEGLAKLAAGARLQEDDRLDLEFSRPAVMLEPATAELRKALTEVAEPVLAHLAVESSPGFVAALSLRQSRDAALRLLAQGDLDAAGEVIAQIEATCERERLEPAFLKVVHLAAVDMLALGGQVLEAAGLLDGLCVRSPQDADYANRLALLRRATGDTEGERAAFERLLERVPASADAHRGLALLDESAKHPAAALAHWEAVQSAVPRDPAAAAAIVRLLKQLGRKAEAKRALALAIAADPGLAPLADEVRL